MKLKFSLLSLILTFIALYSCNKESVKIAVSNTTDSEIGTRVIEVKAKEVFSRLNSKGFYVTDEKGDEIPSQFTSDSLIIFKALVPAGKTYIYQINPSDSIHHYPSTVEGRLYPERRDDLAYENELVGFRIYGPSTQKAGEKVYGYDLFFKYPTEELVVPQLYANQTSDILWARVDSLRKINNDLAEEFIKSFTYHIDHGKGMDCYAVGATLGAGVAALIENDSIIYPWCYQNVKILDNGPLRFTVLLEFPVFNFDNTPIKEKRLISLDSDSFLNSCKVWFESLNNPTVIVTGFPLRDSSEPYFQPKKGILAYADPTQGPDNGKALLGVKTKMQADSVVIKDNHILLSYQLNPSDTFDYKWGFSWDKTEIPNMEEWIGYLENSDLEYSVVVK